VIVLDEDGSVRSLTDQASLWLGQIPRDRDTGLELPAVVHAVARRALDLDAAHPHPEPYASVRLRSGSWLTIHGSVLHSAGDDKRTVAVTLGPAAVTEMEPLRLALHGLTPREREVAQLLTRGATNDEIARSLWISRHTVKDHVKAMDTKLDVRTRAELAAKLFHDHIAPRLDSTRIREFVSGGPPG
jgi:DNA-binding CsgD family transcriptional regulator